MARMKLVKVKSNHNNIGDMYVGEPLYPPREKERFVFSISEIGSDGFGIIRTTPVTKVKDLPGGVTEFSTDNSDYRLEPVEA